MPYAVQRVYIADRGLVDLYEPSDITLPEIKQRLTSPNIHAYISIQLNETNGYFDFDLSHFITDFNTNSITTWSAFNSLLTDEVVNGYSCTIPGYKLGSEYPHNPVRLWDATNALRTFRLSYSDHLSESESSYAMRWKQHDLRIQLRSGADSSLVLNKCIPVVNGLVCRKDYSEQTKSLYALGGARLMWQGGTHIVPEVQLLDFSNIGEVHCINVSLTDKEKAVKINPSTFYNPWVCECNKFNLREYTPLVVLCGCMIWSKDISITSEHTFTIDPSKYCIERSALWAKYLRAEPATDAAVSYDTSDVVSIIKSECAEETPNSCFVYFIKTSSLVYREENVRTWSNSLFMDLYAPIGILIRKSTDSITAFHCTELSDRQELIVQNLESLYDADEPINKGQTAFTETDCKDHNFRRLQDSGYKMLYVMARE